MIDAVLFLKGRDRLVASADAVFSGASEDQTLHPLTEGKVAGELAQLFVEAVDVGFRPAAGRLEVRPTSGIRLVWMDVHLAEAVGLYLLFSMGETTKYLNRSASRTAAP